MFNILATSSSTMSTWIRSILFGINESIFKFIGEVYAFIKTLASQSNLIIENTPIGDYTGKIYAFIGVIMLFRIAIVLLQYIADPDKVMDKKDGVGPNVVPRVIVVLALLVMTPTLFSWMYNLQNKIFESEFIENFFVSSVVATKTESIMYEGWFSDFLAELTKQQQEKVDPANKNKNPTIGRGETNERVVLKKEVREIIAAKKAEELEADRRKGTKLADIIMMNFIQPNAAGKENSDYKDEVDKLEKDYNDVENHVDYNVVSKLITLKSDGVYHFEYSGFISLFAGIIVLVLLIATVFRVAIRVFKLLALELIAPIPIILYLDPANNKKGDTSLERWAQAVMITFVDLFVRILVIMFAVMIIEDISTYYSSAAAIGEPSFVLKLFLIFGALGFMNIAPDFIYGLFGKQVKERGTFNPFKQIESVAPFKAAVGGSIGGIGGAGKGLIQGGIGGMAAGGLLGMQAGAKAKTLVSSFGSGRDYVGNSLANGPNETGSILQRQLQRNAANSLRAGSKNAFDTGMEYKKTDLDSARETYENANSTYTKNVADLSKFESTRDLLSSQMSSYQQQGDSAGANQMAHLIEDINTNKIPETKNAISSSKTVLGQASANYDAAIKQYDSYRVKYAEEVQKINVKTGKDATIYAADKPNAEFKEIKRKE